MQSKEKCNKKDNKESKIKVKRPIGRKLSSIFASLIVFFLGITVVLIYILFANDQRVNAKANVVSINETTSGQVESKFHNVHGNTNNFLNILYFIRDDKHYEEESVYFFDEFCKNNEDINFIYSTDVGFWANTKFNNEKTETQISNWFQNNPIVIQSVLKGNVEIKDFSSFTNTPYTLSILFPYNDSVVCVCFDIGDLKEACFKNANSSFVVNRRGEALIYENNDTIENSVADFSIIQEIISYGSGSEYVFTDSNNQNWIYVRMNILDDACSVITLTSESTILKAINLTALRIICVTVALFFLAILIIRFFSRTITTPINELVLATNSIDRGEYDLNLKPRTKDEVGYLTDRFIVMASGLAERQRLMTTFTKFVNKSIAQKAAEGKLSLGGEDKQATVFFSDIRSFTAMSENMSAPQVVEFLNDYFTRMVNCVNKTNGIVDKFIGDAVMAVWGAATTCGSPAEDAWAAVKTALMMRIELYHFNQNQIKNGKNPIKIGCGINSGPIVAGQIGSEDHMNYTVIGDTVNLASRTEALNKPFATDILITENTYLLIKDKIIAEEMPGVTVKGKTAPIKMYAVINAIDVKGPDNIHKLREFLGWDEPDLSGVNTDEEEKKYKIGK